MKNQLITFEIDKEHEKLDFHLNKQGLDYIVKVLNELRNKNENDHFHLMTPEGW